jgi:prepilin-type N-terminal cleavage/methylation domain-containing protein
MPISSTGNWNNHSGFTLVELAVVTLLVALLAAVTVPLFGTGRRGDLHATARRVAGMSRYYFQEAALSGRDHRLEFDLDRQVFVVKRLEENGELVAVKGIGRKKSPAGEVRITDVTITGRGRSSGTATVRILPVGWLEETVVHLEDQGGRQLTVRLMPLTGSSETYEGHREF